MRRTDFRPPCFAFFRVFQSVGNMNVFTKKIKSDKISMKLKKDEHYF